MTDKPTMQERLSTGRGRWTPEHPEWGTGPVSYDDAISEEFFADEREAIFRRWWLYVGRAERLTRPGTYFTRELGTVASIVVARDLDGEIHAFQNACAHRGNKVVWQEHPGEEISGSTRTFNCKYHGWQYGLDGTAVHITNHEQFFHLDEFELRMPKLHCDVMGGFIFVSLADDPPPLCDFLGPELCELEGYPWHLMTQRHSFRTRVNGNWKLAANTIQEWYHPPYLHQKFINPDVRVAEKSVPPIDSYHYEFWDKHFLNSVPGPPPMPSAEGSVGEPAQDMLWIYRLFRGGLFGPDDAPDIGAKPDFLNRGDIRSWGNDQWWLLPNFSLQLWARDWYVTYLYWPESVDSHMYEIDIYFVPPTTARERLAQQLSVDSVIEFALQDVNTVEATHRGVSSRAHSQYHLSDQEVMVRSFHHTIGQAVADYRAEQAGTGA